MKTKSILITIFLFLAFTIQAKLPKHPCLLLTQKGIEKIKAQNKPAMLFNTTLIQIKNQIDPILKQPIEVPLPKDAGGGYTHEQHKRNYNNIC